MTERDAPSHAILFGGSGDTGRRLAAELRDRGSQVVVTTRRESEELSGEVFDRVEVRRWAGAEDPDGLADLLTSVETRCDGAIAAYNLVGAWLQHAEEAILGTAEVLAEACRELDADVRLVHCGATSVYGDRPGETLDASSPRSPELRVGRIHARAEDALLAADTPGVEPYVLRLPHIYGPGRERTFEWMCQGEFAVVGDGHNPMHHLYITDLVEALAAAATAPRPDPPLLNVVDDLAAPYGDYCDFITEACGHPPLERIELDEAKRTDYFVDWLGPHMAEADVLEEFYGFMTSSVTIDNRLMKEMLEFELAYPSYRDGLCEMLDQRDVS